MSADGADKKGLNTLFLLVFIKNTSLKMIIFQLYHPAPCILI